MGLEASIKTALAAVAGGRVHPDRPPDNPTYPCVIYQQVGGDVLNPLDSSDPNTDNARVQVVTWAKTRLEASSIAGQVRAALGSALSASLMGAPASLYDETTKLYGARADYSIWYTP
jgi:hypothetical protein